MIVRKEAVTGRASVSTSYVTAFADICFNHSAHHMKKDTTK